MARMPKPSTARAIIARINHGCSVGFFSRCLMLGFRIGTSSPLPRLLSVLDPDTLLLMIGLKVVSSVDGLPMVFVELGASLTPLTLGVASGVTMVR